MAEKQIMHVISGTHWDREWRYTAEQSKLRLVDLIDSLLDILERKPEYKSFCLDGGMIVLEDYLTVRPHNRERLRKLIEARRIHLVNWYTLPETFTVAAEAIVRNLLLGTKMANEFGGAMKAGYTATSYGQTSQLPQVYQGFGISTAMFYRGTNKYEMPTLFIWEGKDGSRLHTVRTFDDVTRTNWFFYVHYSLVLDKVAGDMATRYQRGEVPTHMCDDSLYERPWRLLNEPPVFRSDKQSLAKALDLIRNQAQPFAVGKHVLALNIEDNARPFEPMPEMITALNAIAPDMTIVQSTFDEYFEQILCDNDDEKLPVFRGELRHPGVAPGFNGLYGATHSSRVKIKLLNDESETWLIHHAEPYAAFAAMYGMEYPATMLARAWRFLLQNQPHDSICGAALDQAHEDMLYRFSMAKTVGQEVAARSIGALYNSINSRGTFDGERDFTITLFNSLPYERSEVTHIVLDLPASGVSGGPVDPCTGSARFEKEIDYFDIIDSEGNQVEYQILSKEKIWTGVERELDTATLLNMVRRRLLLHVRVPAMGYTTLAVRPREPRRVLHPQPGPDRPLIARLNGVLENDAMRVQIAPNGTFSITHKETGRTYSGLHAFADYGQTGSAHLSLGPQRNPVITSLGCQAKITMQESNLLRGVYRIDLTLRIPAAATLDARDRMHEEVDLPITTWLTLEKDAEFLRIRTTLTNHARDHKLQINLPTGLSTNTVAVESAFAVDERDMRYRETADNSERWFTYQPMQTFVDMSDGQAGLAFLSKGLREYEAMDDPDRTLAITLLRTHRAYMTANPSMIPEEFDRYTGLHSFGTLEFSYALYPHKGNWSEGNVLQTAYRHKVDLKAILGIPKEGTLPCTASFFTLEPSDALMISAVKQAEDGSGIVVRVWNSSPSTVNAALSTILPVHAVFRLRLDETRTGEISMRDGRAQIEIAPHKVETILLVQ